MSASWIRNLRRKLFGSEGNARLPGSRYSSKQRLRRSVPRLEALEDRTAPSVTIANVPQWDSQGPGPIQIDSTAYGTYAGAVESLAVEPITNIPNTPTQYVVYAGTVNGGVWRAYSKDSIGNYVGYITSADPNNTFWFPKSDNQPSLAISSLRLDPTDLSDNTLWAGTGSLSSSSPTGGTGGGGRGVGLLKTTDGGQSWTILGGQQLAGKTIVGVLPTSVNDPSSTSGNQQVVLVATLFSGIMRSNDGGQTFYPVAAVDANRNLTSLTGTATDLIVDPLDPDRFYAAVVGFGGGGNAGIFESNDNLGTSWTEMPGDSATTQINGADNLKLATQVNGTSTTLFVATGGDQQVVLNVAPTGYAPPTGGTFTLTLNGKTTAPIAYNATAAAVQSALQALPLNGSGNILVSPGPAGGSWQVSLPGSLARSALQGKGAALTGGTSPAVNIGTSVVSGAFQGTVLVGGVSQWNQMGSVPTGVSPFGPYVPPEDVFLGHFAAAADPTQAGILYVATFQGNIFRVNANGGSWTSIDTPNAAPGKIHDDHRHLAFLGSTLLDSNDGGIYALGNPRNPGPSDSWVALNANLADTEFYNAQLDPRTLQIFGGSQDNGTPVGVSTVTVPPRAWTLEQGGNSDGGPSAMGLDHQYYSRANFGDYYYDGTALPAPPDGSGAWFNNFNGGGNRPIGASPVLPGQLMLESTKGNLYEITLAGGAQATAIVSGGVVVAVIVTNGGSGYGTAPTVSFAGGVGVGARAFASIANGHVTSITVTNGGVGYGSAPVVALSGGGLTMNNVTPTGLPGRSAVSGNVQAIAYGVNNPNAAYFGTSQADLWYRSTPGASFQYVAQDYRAKGGASVNEIVVDPYDATTAYVLDTNGQVWQTKNGGGTWNDVSGDLGTIAIGVNSLGNAIPFVPVTLTLADPNPTQAGQGALVAGGLGGVYSLALGSGSSGWQTVAQGLPNVQVTDLHYVGGSLDVLLAGTFGRGMWQVSEASQALFNSPLADITVTDDDAQQNRIVIDAVPGFAGCLEVKVNGRVECTAPAYRVGSITVNESSANDTVDVENTFFGVPITINEGIGSDTVNISPTAKLFGNIIADVGINAPTFSGGGHTLNVYDSQDPTGDTFTLTATTIADNRFFGGTITYGNQQVVNLFGSTVAPSFRGSTFNVQSTAVGTSTSIIGGSAGDTVNVGNSTDGLGDIAGALNIENPTAHNTSINIDASADTSASTFTLSTLGANPADTQGDSDTWGQISGLPGGGLINYEYPDTASLTLKTGDDAAVNVLATGPGVTNLFGPSPVFLLFPTHITVNVGNGGSLVDISGTLNIENPSGSSDITVDDSADTSASTFTLSTLGANPADTQGDSDTWGQISGLPGGGLINYEYPDTPSLTFKTGWRATVNVLATGVTTNLVGNGPTTVKVGNSTDGVQDVAGTLNIENPPALTTVTVDDSADTSAPTFTLSTLGVNPADSEYAQGVRDIWGQISGLPSGAVINYEYPDTASLTLKTGAGATTDVLATGVTTTLVGNGPTTVNVGNQDNVQGVGGSLFIQNTVAGQGTVDVNDSLDPTALPSAVVLDQYQDPLTGLLYESINNLSLAAPIYVEDDVSSLTVHGDNAGNTFYVRATAALHKGTTLDAGTGGDTINVGSTANTLDPIQGALTVTGGGNTTLNVTDLGTPTTQTWIIDPSSIERFAGATPPAVPQVTYHNLSTVNVTTGTGGNVVHIHGTAKGTTTTVTGNGTGDEFLLGNAADRLDDMLGPLALHDANLYNLQIIDLENLVNETPAAHNYTLTTGQLVRDGIQPITFDSGVSLVVYASAGGGTVDVPIYGGNSLTQIQVNSGDTVTVGSQAGQGLSQITADLAIVSQPRTERPHVILDDSADPRTPRTIALGSDPLFGYLVSGLANASQGRGRIGLSLDPASPVSIVAGAATVLFQVKDLTNAPALSLVGNAQGTTTLQGPNTANTWQITGTNAGTLDGTVAFSGVQNLIGGSAGNTFAFHTGGSLAGTLNGGGGTNTLDYTAYQGDILVDLLLHTASLVGQGVSNVANVYGSQGNDLIVGDAGLNVLVGGTLRNVIIGDGGPDTITGGGGFNLLIGGITSYDSGPNALQALQALQLYWDNPSATILDSLVNPLRKGVTYNGQFLIFNKTTVRTDNAADTLTGGSGTSAPTWFIEDKDGDTIDHGAGPRPNIDRLLVI
jgi:hypothetical protein